MAINLVARCSECYGTVDLDIEAEDEEITCPVCGHSVPNFDADDFDRISFHQERTHKATIFSGVAFGGSIVLFLIFLKFSEAAEPNQGIVMVAGLLAVAAVIASMVFGWKASAEEIVAEI